MERELQEREAQAERERQEQKELMMEKERLENERMEREKLENDRMEREKLEQQDWERGRRSSSAGKDGGQDREEVQPASPGSPGLECSSSSGHAHSKRLTNHTAYIRQQSQGCQRGVSLLSTVHVHMSSCPGKESKHGLLSSVLDHGGFHQACWLSVLCCDTSIAWLTGDFGVGSF